MRTRTSPRDRLRRLAVVAAVTCAVWVFAAPAAFGSLEGPCDGTATIDGVTYDASFDSADKPIVVPENRNGLQIPYSGAITVENTNYLGAVGVVVGPVTVNVADWGLDENVDDVRATNPDAIYTLGGELDSIVGLYRVTAFHDADGGNCDADAMVKLEGSVLSTPVGAGATAGAVIAGVGVLAAGIPKGKRQ